MNLYWVITKFRNQWSKIINFDRAYVLVFLICVHVHVLYLLMFLKLKFKDIEKSTYMYMLLYTIKFEIIWF